MAYVEQSNAEPRSRSFVALAVAATVALALVVRIVGAHSRFLNADECMHYLYSLQPSFRATYESSLHTAHPPLLILLIHYWSKISSDELFLRIPSVLAGTLAGLLLYLWLKRVADACTALIALALFLFSPALIYLSFEVRQYALLLMFIAAALYFLDRALMENSTAAMVAYLVVLYLALLTHYSALIFAFCVGLYGLWRLFSAKPRKWVAAIWAAGQMGAVVLAAFLWKSHIILIRRVGMVQHVAESYLRGSLYQPGEENPAVFVVRANIRLFKFLFSQGAVGIVGLTLFAVGIALLLRHDTTSLDGPSGPLRLDKKPAPRQLGMLFLAPFVVNCIAALVDRYPYGGSRHNSYLALFAFPPIAFAIAKWPMKRKWVKPAVILAALATCNFTVSPAGAYIKAKDQRRDLMRAAVDNVHRSVPPGSILLADYESALLLGNYVCRKNVVQTAPPYQLFLISDCAGYKSVTLLPPLWVFRADTFAQQMTQLHTTLTAESLQGPEIWLFQAGYIVDREPQFRTLLSQYGCSQPQEFGANIIVCRLWLSK